MLMFSPFYLIIANLEKRERVRFKLNIGDITVGVEGSTNSCLFHLLNQMHLACFSLVTCNGFMPLRGSRLEDN